MFNVCVFCASSEPKNKQISKDCASLADCLVKGGHTLVYGGASVGLMWLVAGRVAAAGGHIIGIMPKFLTNREICSVTLDEKYIVSNMAERKTMMIEKSDAFVILPGGVGTLDEFFEVVCLSSLGKVRKPIVLLNSAGFFDDLLKFMEHAYQEGVLPLHYGRYFVTVNSPEEVLPAIENFQLPPVPDWVFARLGFN
ncbi:MAG: TIGR00730 family Rossman fold protein [Candidatus Bruticola sp.]